MKQQILWKETNLPVRVGERYQHEEGETKVIEILQDWRVLIQFTDRMIRPNYRVLTPEEIGAMLTLSEKPPLGLTPRFIWIAQRIDDIRDAMDRYEKAGVAIPRPWITEYAALQKTMFPSDVPEPIDYEHFAYHPAYSMEQLTIMRADALPFALSLDPMEVVVEGQELINVAQNNTLVAVIQNHTIAELVAFCLNNAKNLLRKK